MTIVIVAAGALWATDNDSRVVGKTARAQVASASPRCLPPTCRVTRVPDMATLTASSNRKFNVVIGVFSKSQERNAIQLTLPAIVVKDGERVIISDTATENFVVAE